MREDVVKLLREIDSYPAAGSDIYRLSHRRHQRRGKTQYSRSNNGSEFIATALQDWLR